MKVLTRFDFLGLPPGTIFAKGGEWFFEGPYVKGNTIQPDEKGFMGDYYYLDTNWPYFENALDILTESLSTGSSFEQEISFTRDGSFDVDELFLVYEKEDLLEWRDYINEALEIANG